MEGVLELVVDVLVMGALVVHVLVGLLALAVDYLVVGGALVVDILIEGDVLALVANALIGGDALSVVVVDATVVYLQILELDELVEEV